MHQAIPGLCCTIHRPYCTKPIQIESLPRMWKCSGHPDLPVNGCAVTMVTRSWFSPCCLPMASLQICLQRSRLAPRNLHCDSNVSGKGKTLACFSARRSRPFHNAASPTSPPLSPLPGATQAPFTSPSLCPSSVLFPPALLLPSSSNAPRLAQRSLFPIARLTAPPQGLITPAVLSLRVNTLALNSTGAEPPGAPRTNE